MQEILNTVTHGVGALFALFGLVVLTVSAYLQGSIWHQVSFIIYGVTLVLLYVASALYHGFMNKKIKYILKICDHIAIYLLIAGTYTPFALVPLHGILGWSLFGVIWLLAVIGIVFKVFFVKRFKIISTVCYIIMGWVILIAIRPLVAALPLAGLYWLIAGGVFYTAGTVFYLNKRFPFNHAIWHLFVLAGSISHFITIFVYVLPIRVPA
ncbi:MAG TPA: hemolysin III family protein [Negativicutes bacterium]|jgi:hemolysin III